MKSAAGSSPDPSAEWWSTSEVAAYLGVRVATVSTNRSRGLMPAPERSLGRTHLWRPDTIVRWHASRRRAGVGGRARGSASAKAVPAEVEVPAPPSGGSRWAVHGERVLYDNEWARLSLVDVEPPGSERYESHVVTLPGAAITAVLDDEGERVLLMWRHRFAVDRWGWELPGGVVEAGEDPAVTAAREVEEETGYRPRGVEHVVTFEPMTGQVRSPHHVFVAHGAERVGEATETTEADRIVWMPRSRILPMVREGQLPSSGALVALLYIAAAL